jgi:hypothetical protein
VVGQVGCDETEDPVPSVTDTEEGLPHRAARADVRTPAMPDEGSQGCENVAGAEDDESCRRGSRRVGLQILRSLSSPSRQVEQRTGPVMLDQHDNQDHGDRRDGADASSSAT